MANLLPILKKFSQEVSGATKYFHFVLWTVLFFLMLVIALSFPTEYPRSANYRFGIGISIWGITCGILSLLFWYIPQKVIERKKRDGKDWNGMLTAANLALVKAVIFPSCGFFLFSLFVIHIFSESWIQTPSTVFGKLNKEIEKNLSYKEQKEEFEANLAKANEGDPSSQVKVGYAYSQGNGIVQNKKKAVEWYKKATEQGYATAQYKLGFMYDNGTGVPQDKKKAIEYYTLAAEQGDIKAEYVLGIMYGNGEGVPQNYKTAIKWYKKAADQGYASAQFNLALAYENGKGCDPDKEKALKYYTLSAEQGDTQAQVNLMLINLGLGKGIWKDYPFNEKGFLYWAAKATDNGETYSAYLLGDFFAFLGRKECAIKFLQFAAFEGEGYAAKQSKELLRGYGRNFEDTPVAMVWAVLKGGKRGAETYKPKGWEK